MNSSKQPTTSKATTASTISRRELIHAAAATALGAAAIPLANGLAPLPTYAGPICYKDNPTPQDKQHGLVALDDTNSIYPFLAAWLLLTTNANWAATATASNMVNIVNLQSTCNQSILNAMTGNSQSFKDVRKAFHDLAKTWSPINYTGVECPKIYNAIKKIAALYTPTP